MARVRGGYQWGKVMIDVLLMVGVFVVLPALIAATMNHDR